MDIKKTLTLLLLLTLPFSCQKGPQKKKSDHVVRLSILSDPPSLDPRNAGDNISDIILKQCYEGLFRKDLRGEIQPALAERYEVSETGQGS